MKTESAKKKKTKATILSGVSSAVGAAVGVAGGLVADSAFAAEQSEIEVEPIEESQVRPVATNPPQRVITQVQEDIIVELDEPEPEVAEVVEAVSETPEPQVVTPIDEPMQNLEIVEVTVDGVSYTYSDLDMDGVVDIVSVDENTNGQEDFGEVVNISPEGILMSDVYEMTQPQTLEIPQIEIPQTQISQVEIPQTEELAIADLEDNSAFDYLALNDNLDMPDFVNNADINEFMA